MTSIPERRDTREAALHSLARAGIDNVHVVEQQDPSRGGDAYFRTIHTALSHGDENEPLLYSRSRSFYPRHVIQMIDSGRDIPPGLYPVRNSRRWYGSQALLLSPFATATILSSWQPEYLDNQIRVLFENVCVYLPNPVQHMAARRTWGGGKPHVSLTYKEVL